MKLVQAVSDVGVDLTLASRHEHYAIMLSFLPGLGLRKADKLARDILQRQKSIESRINLDDYVPPNVYKNCFCFVRLTPTSYASYLDPLENTRIHPVCYSIFDFVRKICADALGEENRPERQVTLVNSTRQKIRGKLGKCLYGTKKDMPDPRWRRLVEKEFLLGPSIIGKGGISKVYLELDDILSELNLDLYAASLKEAGKGDRRYDLKLIVDELRFPWLDSRQPLNEIPRTELFKEVAKEDIFSLHLGKKLRCRVMNIVQEDNQRRSSTTTSNNNFPLGRLIVKTTDTNLLGSIYYHDFADNINRVVFDHVKIDDELTCCIIGVKFDKLHLILSARKSILAKPESWWLRNRRAQDLDQRCAEWWKEYENQLSVSTVPKDRRMRDLYDPYFVEDDALKIIEEMEEKTANYLRENLATKPTEDIMEVSTHSNNRLVSAVVFHPYFYDKLDFRSAEEKLRTDFNRPGVAIIRPSSKKDPFFTITWAFHKNLYRHISVEQVTNSSDLNRPYFKIDDDGTADRPSYSDLDELFQEYIERMNSYVTAMVQHKSFRPNSAKEVEEELHKSLRENKQRIPYLVRFEYNKPGWFVIVCLLLVGAQSQALKKEMNVLVTSSVCTIVISILIIIIIVLLCVCLGLSYNGSMLFNTN
jgi:hypothetical protein